MICRYPINDCSRKFFDESRNIFLCESTEPFCSYDKISNKVTKESDYNYKKEKGQTELL